MVDSEVLLSEALLDIERASDEKSLDSLRVQYLGKKGSFTDLLKTLGKLPAGQRPAACEQINLAKKNLQRALELKRKALIAAALNERLEAGRLDVTLPGRRHSRGGLHPITMTIERIKSIFAGAGYDVAEGPDIEDDYYNFEALNSAFCGFCNKKHQELE